MKIEFGPIFLSSYILKQQCLSVYVGNAWKIVPITCPFHAECFGGGGKESSVKHGARGSARGGPTRARGRGMGEEGPGGCIMHRVHTSNNNVFLEC
jgi:hypothetical protein